MAAYFFYGMMQDPALRDLMLDAPRDVAPARLADHVVRAVQGQEFPMILDQPGAAATGVAVRDLTAQELDRINHVAGVLGFQLRQIVVEGQVWQIWLPEAGRWRPDGPWDLAQWQERGAPLMRAAVADLLALRDDRPAQALSARWPMIAVRAAARLLARQGKGEAEALGAGAAPRAADVEVMTRREPYANFFSVEEYDLRYRRFDGGVTPVVNRAVFVTGDAATVLPYDPQRDRVLLIEQFRMGPFARGDAAPWLLEPIAGRVDARETPEEAIRREAQEEAGLSLGALLPVGGFYPTPAAKSEYLHSFIGLADLPDAAAGFGGLDEEAEDIRAHLLGYDRLMQLVDDGALSNGPLVLSALWLARHRERIRAGA
ncbi:NUDIX domain-containing protein [Plastorhodobacter daqingensis]|uniref:ADP-ribose pyrophosphatase n=1 Tax=Plastorhodobacter daqingensis TaxID=1387281 RepID=A0ABW2UKP8_9RHOB